MNLSKLLGALWVSLACANGLVADAVAADMVPGYPDRIEEYDSREVAMLPSYCIYTQLFRDSIPGGNNKAEIQRWTEVMGPTFNAMHHYCWGLMKTNRAVILARDQRIRNFYLDDSIHEFNFVLKNASPDFVLLPEILTKKGQNLLKLGRNVQGVRELEHAIEIKEDYWPPYAALSDYYKKNGDLIHARQMLEKGLTFAPDTIGLTRRLSELEGAKVKKHSVQLAPSANK